MSGSGSAIPWFTFTLGILEGLGTGSAKLSTVSEMWLYPTLWTSIILATVHMFAGFWAYIVFRKYRLSILCVLLFALWGFGVGFIGSSLTHACVAAIYVFSGFSMTALAGLSWAIFHACVFLFASTTTLFVFH